MAQDFQAFFDLTQHLKRKITSDQKPYKSNLKLLCFFIHFILLTFATIYKLGIGIQHHADIISYVKICTI